MFSIAVQTVPVTILAGLGAGALMGALTGWLVGYQRIPSFIVTLARQAIHAPGEDFSIQVLTFPWWEGPYGAGPDHHGGSDHDCSTH